jgi:predicted nuclease with TOPRIM domain
MEVIVMAAATGNKEPDPLEATVKKLEGQVKDLKSHCDGLQAEVNLLKSQINDLGLESIDENIGDLQKAMLTVGENHPAGQMARERVIEKARVLLGDQGPKE